MHVRALSRVARVTGVLACACALAVLLCAWALPAQAKSSGILGFCDLTPQWYPPRGYGSRFPGSQLWPNGRIGGNWSSSILLNKHLQNSDVGMYWVQAPVPSSVYTLRSADGPAAEDPTEYTPGVPTSIHVRVNNADLAYIGLLLYATNNSGVMYPVLEKQVGSWDIMPGDAFIKPPACKGTAITHADADYKPTHVSFRWTGLKGTGSVRFRILLKQGEQNTGNFYWPARELVLREGASPVADLTAPALTLGAPGASCASVCATVPATPYCHASAMAAINSADKLDAMLANSIPVALPYISSCAYAGPPSLSADGYASYPSGTSAAALAADCPPGYVAAAQANPPMQVPDICWAGLLPEVQGLCLCHADSSNGTPNPYSPDAIAKAQAGNKMGTAAAAAVSAATPAAAASKLPAVLCALLLAVVSSRSGSVRSASLLCCVVCVLVLLAAPASAHNFIAGVHRATAASIQKPCIAKIGPQPHVQVVPGQQFETEWTQGHGLAAQIPFWFAVLHESDYDNLKNLSLLTQFQDYLNLAPAEAVLTDPKWDRNHIALKSNCRDLTPPNPSFICNKDHYFGEGNGSLSSSHPLFIQRDPVYKSKAKPLSYNVDESLISQNTLLPQFKANDKRAAYVSEKYPWIESVHKFMNLYVEESAYPGQLDIARFTLEARKGSGNYIMYFAWSGYGDCIDINVQAPLPGAPGFTADGQIVNRYGELAAVSTPEVVRMDHCEFRQISNPVTPARILSADRNVTTCLQECVRLGVGCDAIVVTRATNTPNTQYKPPNLPWHPWFYNTTLYRTDAVQHGVDSYGAPVAPYTTQTRLDPCFEYRNNDRELRGCKSAPNKFITRTGPTAILPADDDYVCFGMTQRRDSDSQVTEAYRIVTDPTDPIWYSSCLFPIGVGGFVQLPNYTQTVPPWKQFNKCVSCDFHKTLLAKPASWVPDWSLALTDTCRNCDVLMAAGSTAAVKLVADYPQMHGYVAPVDPTNNQPAGGAHAGDGGTAGSSSGSGPLANTTHLALLIVACGIGAVLLAVAAVLLVRRQRSRQASRTELKEHFSAGAVTSDAHTELARNPAAVDW